MRKTMPKFKAIVGKIQKDILQSERISVGSYPQNSNKVSRSSGLQYTTQSKRTQALLYKIVHLC